MQATEDGEFYPEKDLDKNYRIPKRPAPQDGDRKAHNSGLSASSSHVPAVQTPLANSYYNYPYDPSAASAYYQNYSQYYQQYGQGSGRDFGHPPLPPPPPGTGVEPIKQNIYNTLKDIKEKPKNYNINYFQHTVPDIIDETLPKDLKAMFQPLFCKLCSAQLSSNQTAKMHYKSKNHEKQIKKWLTAYCERTGEPLPKRARVAEKQQGDAEKNPTWYHCEVCDLDLTGKLHAESHYMGRSHQKAMMGWRAPAGSGYYDDQGKWVRRKGQKSQAFNFENGEDNFGFAFKKEEPKSAEIEAPPAKKKKEAPPAKKKKEAPPPQTFHCEVCDINTTCQEQLDNHFRGQKHMKKLKQVGLNKYSEQRDLVEQAGQLPPTPSIAESSHSHNDKDLNLSVYRTPSGDYYCPSCNITSNSEAQFVQHMKSKNHAKKLAQKKAGAH